MNLIKELTISELISITLVILAFIAMVWWAVDILWYILVLK